VALDFLTPFNDAGFRGLLPILILFEHGKELLDAEFFQERLKVASLFTIQDLTQLLKKTH